VRTRACESHHINQQRSSSTDASLARRKDRAALHTRTQKKIVSSEEEGVIDSSSSAQVAVAAREARAPENYRRDETKAASGDSRRETRLLRRGFSSAQMFESGNDIRTVTTVVATIHPSGLSSEYDLTGIGQKHFT